MKLEEMRAIAEMRTKGEWKADGRNVYNNIFVPIIAERSDERLITCDGGYVSNNGENQKSDAEFIAMAANNIDRLLYCIEIAKELVNYDGYIEDGIVEARLRGALAMLEEEKLP